MTFKSQVKALKRLGLGEEEIKKLVDATLASSQSGLTLAEAFDAAAVAYYSDKIARRGVPSISRELQRWGK
jgi:hypothetical protein